MRKQIPQGPSDEKCYQSGRKCSEACFADGCKCVLWVEFRGKDALGNDVDGWYCSQALLPQLMLEVAQQLRQGSAEVVARIKESTAATENFHDAMAQPRVADIPALPELRRLLLEAAP
jgi:hypothetical protein